jgi:peptide/nickel transport system ATP-binding protein
MKSSEIILEVKDLNIRFRHGDVWNDAVKSLSFSLFKGETLGLVGESGSGKSVTSMALMRLFKRSKNIEISGEAIFYLNDEAIDLLNCDEMLIEKLRGDRISMIFQEPMTALNPVKTCGSQVAEVLIKHLKVKKEEAFQLTIDLFEKVELPEAKKMFKRFPHELSGGQKQRVMIAMAMSCTPSLLIADEPTTALDVTVQKHILELLSNLQTYTQTGMLFITHDLGVVSDIADRVLVLYKGDLVEEGITSEVFANPKHPYTRGLLACRPPLDKYLEHLPTVEDYLKGRSVDIKERIPGATSSKDEILIRAEGIKTWYPSKRNFWGKTTQYFKAVNDVSLEVYKGETLGLVGESGCGKTTLGRTLLALVPAKKGLVLYKDEDLLKKSRKELLPIRKNLQIIFQDPFSSLNPKIKVGNAIMEVMKVHSLPKSGSYRDDVITLLQKVGLDEQYFNRYPFELSGGQRQRVCIARALAVNPEFIVCDESVSALDVSVQAQVLNLLNDLKKEFAFTFVFISHDLSVVKHMSDRIIVMNKGKIVEQGTPDQIFHHARSPYTQKFVDSIPGRINR